MQSKRLKIYKKYAQNLLDSKNAYFCDCSSERLEKVRQDKLREVKAGHDGTWVAHPGLVEVAMDIFNQHMKGPNQLQVKREEVAITAKDLLQVP